MGPSLIHFGELATLFLLNAEATREMVEPKIDGCPENTRTG